MHLHPLDPSVVQGQLLHTPQRYRTIMLTIHCRLFQGMNAMESQEKMVQAMIPEFLEEKMVGVYKTQMYSHLQQSEIQQPHCWYHRLWSQATAQVQKCFVSFVSRSPFNSLTSFLIICIFSTTFYFQRVMRGR